MKTNSTHIKIIISIILLCTLNGCCALFKKIDFNKSEQTLFFSSDYNPNSDNKIYTDGFYWFKNKTYNPDLWYEHALIFYNDGTFTPISLKNDSTLFTHIKNKEIKNFDEYNNPPALKYANYFKNGTYVTEFEDHAPPLKYIDDFNGGIYTIKGDTIIAELYTEYCTYRGLKKSKYLIINKSLIKLISYEYFYKDSTQIFNYAEKDFELEFIKATPMPSPFDAKFRTKKWMWADKKDWKEYMRQLKEYEAAKNRRQTGTGNKHDYQ